ncbi:MAG: hypothetical protein GY703_03070 [Gammaproteobacteria bacterium]|nr:hypothetical protein [Gammaproteobacteria bacterium]
MPTHIAMEQRLVTHKPFYTALGTDKEAQQAAYRGLFHYQLDSGMVNEIRAWNNGNCASDSSQF